MNKKTPQQMLRQNKSGHAGLNSSFLFWQLSLSYILLLIMSLVIGIITVLHTKSNLLEQAESTNKLQLENAMNIIDNSFLAINDVSATLCASTNTEVQNFIAFSSTEKGQLTFTLQKTMKNLLPFQDTNNLIDGYFLYSKINGTLAAPGQGFIRADLYYDKYFKYADMSYSEWKEDILEARSYKKILSSQNFMYGGNEADRILYINSIYNKMGKQVGQAVFLLNAEKIQQLMLPAVGENSGNMFILDTSGNILLSYTEDDILGQAVRTMRYDQSANVSNFEQSINGTKYFVSYLASESTGWAYIITIPSEVIYRQAFSMLKTIILMLLISYAVVLAITLASFKINRNPLVGMVNCLPAEMLQPKKLMRNGVSFLNSTVSQIVSDNIQMEKQMEEQKRFIKNMVLFELEAGEIKGGEDMEQIAAYLALSVEGKRFYGAYLLIRDRGKYKNADSSSVPYQDILNLVSSYDEYIPLIEPKERNMFVLIFQQEQSDSIQDYRNTFRDLYHNLYSSFDLDTVICVGPAVTDLLQVSRSFEAAKSLISSGTCTPFNSKFLLEYTAASSEAQMYYPIQLEQKLLSLILACDKGSIQVLLDEIYKKNFEANYLTGFMRKVLYSRIMGTIIGYSEMVPLDQELTHSLSSLEPGYFFNLIKRQCADICECLRESNESSNTLLMQDIKKYIEENYHSCNLSLSYIALKFDISESCLSTRFKDSFGQTFSAYVEELRLKKANQYLAEGTLSIAEIGEKIGYLSPHSFRRAYKRLYGFCPSQFKYEDKISGISD